MTCVSVLPSRQNVQARALSSTSRRSRRVLHVQWPSRPTFAPALRNLCQFNDASLSSGTCLFCYLHLNRADLLEVKTVSCVFDRKYGFHNAASHHDLARFQNHVARSQLRGKPPD